MQKGVSVSAGAQRLLKILGLVFLMVAGFFLYRSAGAGDGGGAFKPLSASPRESGAPPAGSRKGECPRGESARTVRREACAESRSALLMEAPPGGAVAEADRERRGLLPGAEPSDGSGSVSGEGEAGAAGGARELLVVYILGAVKSPGVFRVPPGTRLAEVVKAAGGATRDGDLTQVNLAMRLADEDMIYLPERRPSSSAPAPPMSGGRRSAREMSGASGGSWPPPRVQSPARGKKIVLADAGSPTSTTSAGRAKGPRYLPRSAGPAAEQGGTPDGSTKAAPPEGPALRRKAPPGGVPYHEILDRNVGGPRNVVIASVPRVAEGRGEASRPVNLNRAPVEELMELPGIGRTRAEKIVLYREALGGFESVDDLLEIPGFGEGIVRRLKGFVTL